MFPGRGRPAWVQPGAVGAVAGMATSVPGRRQEPISLSIWDLDAERGTVSIRQGEAGGTA